jgi:hypothetical protein
VVTLTATADLGSAFIVWTGSGCTGTGDCVVTMGAAHAETATFDTSSVLRQPDEWIGTKKDPAKIVGDGIYNATGKKQARSTRANPARRGTST